jgi:hypothetical protein
MLGHLIKTDLEGIYASSFPIKEEAINEVLKVSGANSGEAIKELDQVMLNKLGIQPNQTKDITWEYANGIVLST